MKLASLFAASCLVVLTGCSSSDPADPTDNPPTDDLLAPPADGEGVQFSMIQTIQPGEDIEYCKLVQAPAEGLWIKRQEVRYTPGSHHVLLVGTSYPETLPAEVDPAQRECDGFGEYAVTGLVAGAQSQKSAIMDADLPEGVAVRVEPGQWLVLNTHYLNTAAEPLKAEARINLYSTDESAVTDRAGVLFWYNSVISIGPMSSASANMHCPVTQDITVLDMQSHMHKRGVNYKAQQIDGVYGAPMRELYTNIEWEEVPVGKFDDGELTFTEGDWIEWECDYDNPEDRWVTQGGKTTDEMCMLLATFYPYDENMEFCSPEGGVDNFMLSSFVHGYGEATCGETLQCIIDADGLLNAPYQKCIVDSCEAAGQEVSEVVKCHVTDGNGAACQGDLACLLNACSAEIEACNTVTCGG